MVRGGDLAGTARGRVVRRLVVFAVLAVVATACRAGGGDVSSGSETLVATTVAGTAPSTTAALVEEPEAEAEGSGGDVGVFELAPLPATDAGEAIAALVAETHGSTTDLASDINRLTRFPAVPTPTGTYVRSMWVSTMFLSGNDRFTHRVELELDTVDGPGEVQSVLESSLTADGWSKTSTEHNPDSLIDADHERRTFTRPTETGQEETLAVTSITSSPTGVLVAYRVGGGNEPDFATRFQGWTPPGAPIPGSAAFAGLLINTTYGPDQVHLSLLSEHRYENAPDPSIEGLLAEVETLAASGPVPVLDASTAGVVLDVTGYDLFKVNLFEGLLKVKGERTFPTPPPGAAAQPAGSDSAGGAGESLAAFATAQQFADVLGQVHGPTLDVSAQMQRLGPFPALPTPAGADILAVESGVAIIDPDTVGVSGAVEFAVTGGFDDVDALYQTELAAGGWELARTDTPSSVSGVEVAHSFDHPDVIDSPGFPLVVTITDDPTKSRATVDVEYFEALPADQVDLDRWGGWQGTAPIPTGGHLIGSSVSSRRWQGDTASLTAIYALGHLQRDEVLPAVEQASSGTDYTRNPDWDRTGFVDLEYTHPFFTRAGAVVLSATEGANLRWEAQFPFTRS